MYLKDPVRVRYYRVYTLSLVYRREAWKARREHLVRWLAEKMIFS